jgi:hypothetical protein
MRASSAIHEHLRVSAKYRCHHVDGPIVVEIAKGRTPSCYERGCSRIRWFEAAVAIKRQ